jgi:hypothetical protein
MVGQFLIRRRTLVVLLNLGLRIHFADVWAVEGRE